MTARETILSGETARSALMAVALATFAAVLVAVAARAEFHLWFTPVPITLQVLAVLLIGLSLTPRQSFLALAEYIGAGIVGLPVFSGGGSGIAWLLGPTGGYIWGFLVAAPLVGILAHWLGPRLTIVAALVGIAASMCWAGITWRSGTSWSEMKSAPGYSRTATGWSPSS